MSGQILLNSNHSLTLRISLVSQSIHPQQTKCSHWYFTVAVATSIKLQDCFHWKVHHGGVICYISPGHSTFFSLQIVHFSSGLGTVPSALISSLTRSVPHYQTHVVSQSKQCFPPHGEFPPSRFLTGRLNSSKNIPCGVDGMKILDDARSERLDLAETGSAISTCCCPSCPLSSF
jgi:hypothetical protein